MRKWERGKASACGGDTSAREGKRARKAWKVVVAVEGDECERGKQGRERCWRR